MRRSAGKTLVTVGVVVAVVLALCFAGGWYFLTQMLAPSADELRAAVVLDLPADVTLLEDQASGSRLCMEECLYVHRRYSSPRSTQDTFGVFADALQAKGYACAKFCTGVGEDGTPRLASWVREDAPGVTLWVFAKSKAVNVGEPVDPARDTHVDLYFPR